jgi:tRNA(Ile)-lysidine synthase
MQLTAPAIRTSSPPERLDPAGFAVLMAALGPFERRPHLAVAVSGGADSLALALLAAAWAEARDGRITALTVDHCLRPEAAEEARTVGRWLAGHGIAHRILDWDGPKPASRLQERARSARYALLEAWCRAAGVLHLLTAHHQDDQAETLAFRRSRGSGADGLAAIPPVRELAGLRLLRPLLGTPKAALTAHLQAIGQPWIEDPSNRAPAFARTRLRQTGLDAGALAGEALAWARHRQAAERTLAAWLARHGRLDPAGFLELDRPAFDALPPDLQARVLQRGLMTIGGQIYPPRRPRLQALRTAMQAAGAGRTLAGCRILPRPGRWLICREPAAVGAPAALLPGSAVLWDGRFAARLRHPPGPAEHGPLRLQALGGAGRRQARELDVQGSRRPLPGAVRDSLPALWAGDRLLAVPHLDIQAPGVDPTALALCFHPPWPLAGPPFPGEISARIAARPLRCGVVSLC